MLCKDKYNLRSEKTFTQQYIGITSSVSIIDYHAQMADLCLIKSIAVYRLRTSRSVLSSVILWLWSDELN